MQNKPLLAGFTFVLLLAVCTVALAGNPTTGAAPARKSLAPMGDMLAEFSKSTGIFGYLFPVSGKWTEGIGRMLMVGIGILMMFLAIGKGFEPLLLVPISFGCILANIPMSGITDPGGILYYIYEIGIKTGVFPLLVFMGVGAMTDFGPMIANPKTALLGAAAQFGIFTTLIGALVLSKIVPGINFDLFDASSIGIIGGADGPTAIFLASQLSPNLLGAIAVAAYSYMALVPIIQPPIMRALTNSEERKIRMNQLRYVGKVEKIVFPLAVLGLCLFLLPSAAPLIGFFMFGNLMRECGVVERLSKTAQNGLINIVTILLGLGVGSRLSAQTFLNVETLGILLLGAIAFSIGTASGVLMAKLMNLFSKTKINPLIGSAGVSAVPMAARVSQKLGIEADSENMLLMFAMGPNVSGVIGSAVAAGVLLTLKNMLV
jgi:carboxybiotin decarboxylase